MIQSMFIISAEVLHPCPPAAPDVAPSDHAASRGAWDCSARSQAQRRAAVPCTCRTPDYPRTCVVARGFHAHLLSGAHPGHPHAVSGGGGKCKLSQERVTLGYGHATAIRVCIPRGWSDARSCTRFTGLWGGAVGVTQSKDVLIEKHWGSITDKSVPCPPVSSFLRPQGWQNLMQGRRDSTPVDSFRHSQRTSLLSRTRHPRCVDRAAESTGARGVLRMYAEGRSFEASGEGHHCGYGITYEGQCRADADGGSVCAAVGAFNTGGVLLLGRGGQSTQRQRGERQQYVEASNPPSLRTATSAAIHAAPDKTPTARSPYDSTRLFPSHVGSAEPAARPDAR